MQGKGDYPGGGGRGFGWPDFPREERRPNDKGYSNREEA